MFALALSEGDSGVLSGQRFSNEFFPRDDFLTELRLATAAEIAAFQAEHPRRNYNWLAYDP